MIVRCVIIFCSTLKQTNTHSLNTLPTLTLILATYVALPLVGGSGHKNYILGSTVYNFLFRTVKYSVFNPLTPTSNL